MGGRPELRRNRPLSSSTVAKAGEPCLAHKGTTEVASATEDTVDEADGGAQVIAGGVVGRASVRVWG